jgi:hypothetical protein
MLHCAADGGRGRATGSLTSPSKPLSELRSLPVRLPHPQDHGTVGQLVVQAVTSGVGLKRVAKRLGEAQIERRGVSPAAWLGLFGRAINMGAGCPKGLELGMPSEKLPWYWLVAVEQLLVQGLPPG